MLIRKNRSSRSEIHLNIGVLENVGNFTGKYLCWSLFFNKVAGLQLYLKRRQHRCISKKQLFLQNSSGSCFCKIDLDRPKKGQRLLLLLVQNVSSCIWRTLMFGCLSYFYKGCQTEKPYMTKWTSLRYLTITCYWWCFFSHWR